MKQSTINLLAACVALASAVVPLSAQESSAKLPSFREAFLAQLKDVESKVVGLAETMPQEKYSWRPAEGVRSIGEVYMHIAGANYFFASMVGVKPPSGLDPKMEKTVTDKEKVVAALKASFEHIRNAVENMPDADMAKATKMFGRPATYETVLFTMATHMHEHLGQSIAYARTNGVAPPWSKKES